MSRARYIGLSFELGQLCDAIDAATLLVDALRSSQLASEDHERRAPRALAAVLGLVQQRLRLVTGMIRHRVDPALILSPANEVTGWSLQDDPEIRIRVPPITKAKPRAKARASTKATRGRS